MLRMIVQLPARFEAGAVPRRSNLIVTPLLRPHVTALLCRHNRLAALPRTVMDDQTGQHLAPQHL
jgi:hypothetical protein